LTIKGNAFLHNMVRILIGTLLMLMRNNDEPSKMKEILERRDRHYSGETAPAYGLYLKKVHYPAVYNFLNM
ncbi:MAG TPA: tRNA pseudouridine(38-40) synthase TruA, partial [Spirochaetota bacterium]|nr:tRNA pseudouridine(38-40) synthase TruA [Spirochaetota bacterium]